MTDEDNSLDQTRITTTQDSSRKMINALEIEISQSEVYITIDKPHEIAKQIPKKTLSTFKRIKKAIIFAKRNNDDFGRADSN